MKRKRQGRGKAIHKKEFDREAISKCPPRYKEGRRCEDCSRTLSIYNSSRKCLSYCGKDMARYEI